MAQVSLPKVFVPQCRNNVILILTHRMFYRVHKLGFYDVVLILQIFAQVWVIYFLNHWIAKNNRFWRTSPIFTFIFHTMIFFVFIFTISYTLRFVTRCLWGIRCWSLEVSKYLTFPFTLIVEERKTLIASFWRLLERKAELARLRGVFYQF